MKAVRLTGIRRMETVEVPDPKIEREDDVLLRVAVIGVCGSDVHYYTTGRIGSQVVGYPFAVGHEMAAVVEAVGNGVVNLKPGDRVAVDPAMPCHRCDQCRKGRPHTCLNLRFLGCPGQAEGCLSERLVMPAETCLPIPPNMSLQDAALCEPLAIGLYAARQSIPLQGARVGILGSGPIGLSVMLACLDARAAALYVTDKLETRCAAARGNGATWSGNPDTENVVAAIQKREPSHLDAVFECCGQQEALDQALQLVAPGGKIMVVGIPEFDRYSFQADVARRREITIQHIRRQNGCALAAIDAVANGSVKPGFMATHHFSLAETVQAFDLVDEYRDGVIKAMVHVGDA